MWRFIQNIPYWWRLNRGYRKFKKAVQLTKEMGMPTYERWQAQDYIVRRQQRYARGRN